MNHEMNIILDNPGIQACDAALLGELFLPFLQNARNHSTERHGIKLLKTRILKVHCC
jgi:hypothetical protein